MGRRVATVGLAMVLGLVGVAAPGTGPAPAQAAMPIRAELALPADADLAADAKRPVDDVPPPGMAEIDVETAIGRIGSIAASLPAEAWDVAAVSATLDGDPNAAFAFVRDAIGYDPYPGVLRGADGTLAAHAGNAYDRALLLKSLLDGMGATSRFAFAELDPAAAARLVARAFVRPSGLVEDAGVAALAPLAASDVANRARRDHARLRAMLDPLSEAPAAPSLDEALAAAGHHAWVQLWDGSTWVDHDPSLPGALPGETLAEASATSDEIPPEEYQAVDVAVVAETMVDGALYETPVLERHFDAVGAAAADVFLAFVPESPSGDVGLIGETVGATRFVPVLIVDDAVEYGAGFPIGNGDESGFVDAFGGGSGEAFLGVRLDVTRSDPLREPRVDRRMLIDRVPAEARAAGSITTDQLLPLAEGPNGPAALSAVHHVLVSTGGANVRTEALLRQSVAQANTEVVRGEGDPAVTEDQSPLLPLAMIGRILLTASDAAVVPAVDDAAAIRSFVARPRVYLTSIGPNERDPGQLAFSTDLMVDEVSTIVDDPSSAGEAASRQLWYGLLMTALESELARVMAAGFEEDGREILGASFAMDSPLTLLGAADVAAAPSGIPPALARSLEAGWLAVVPGDPRTATYWWSYLPATGAVRSIGPRDAGATYTSGGGGIWTITEVKPDGKAANVESGLVLNLVAIASIVTIAITYPYVIRSLYRAYLR